ncbi:MAG: TIGR01212 family radical SAM protein [Lentisphaerae bacterium]|nr:TIGR01212 family radical SAM protein [Lentisphaerota bacterium]
MKKIKLFSEYLNEQYGKALHRIPIDLPLSCPNREKSGGAGCIYCASDGNRARHLRHHFSLSEQVAAGIDYVQRRYRDGAPYIAYFQSFTNTYGEPEQLRAWYEEVLALADFKMVIIATRPDCLGTEVMALLKDLSSRYELWVELGVQTSNNLTLELIRRGHDFASVRSAAEVLAEHGIRSAAHIILGLPGENNADFDRTADDLAQLPFSAVKMHQLMIVRGTPLAALYAAGKIAVKPLNEYEYAAAAVRFLRRLPDDWLVMRLMGDPGSEPMIAPKWWMKKGQFISYVQGLMDGNEMRVNTGDGTPTLYHPEYRQHFHSIAGARSEALEKFVEPSGIAEMKNPRLLDVGFGLGYNTLTALEANPRTEVISLEKDPRTINAALELFDPATPHYQMLEALRDGKTWRRLKLLTGDARDTVRDLASGYFDIIFMDGFSPEANPELWTYDFIRELKRVLKPTGTILTYSSAYPVRGAMLRLGFRVAETPAFERRHGGTIARLAGNNALDDKTLNIILKSTAGVPWRDPGLDQTPEKIKELRERLVAKLRARGIPKWFNPKKQ